MDSTYYRTPHSEKNILPGFSFDLHKRLFDIISWNYKAMYNAEIILEHAYLLFFTMKVTFENKGPVSKQMWSLPVGRKDARHLWFQQNHPYRKGPRSHEEPRHFHTTKEGGGGREQGALLEQPRVQTPQGARESGVGPGARISADVTSAQSLEEPRAASSRLCPAGIGPAGHRESGRAPLRPGRGSAVDARFQKSEPSSPKRQLFYIDFVEPTSGLCTLGVFFFPLYLLLLLFLTADP